MEETTEKKTRTRRRSNGEGSISQRSSDQRWVGVITLGIDPYTCKQIRKSVVRATRAEVVAELKKMQQSKDKGTLVKTDKITTLKQWLDYWLNDIKKVSVKPTTFTNYTACVNWVTNEIGNYKIQKVTSSVIQQLIHTLLNDKKLSGRTVNDCINTLNNSLQYAVKHKIIENNPCELVEKPRIEKKEMSTWTEEQLNQFKNICEEYYLEGAMHLLFYGLRRGEILGLTIDCVDFTNKQINIKNTLVMTGDGVTFQKTVKTSASQRVVPLADDTLNLIKSAIAGRRSGLVFITNEGNHIHPRSFQRSFDLLIKRAKLPKIRLHDMRHSACSLLLSNGCDLKTVSQLLGHSNTRVSTDIYLHTNTTKQRAAINVLDKIIIGKE